MNRIPLPDPRCTPLGRHDPKEEKAQLWWSGAGVRFTLDCTYLAAEVTSRHTAHAAWLGVMADGAPVARLPLLPGTHLYPLLSGMEKGVAHEITVLKDTQAGYDESGPVTLEALETDGEITPAPERKRLLEFIGDSLTVGEGCMGPQSGEEWRMVYISHMPAFPTLVSEALGADKRVIALGGWGAARSWDNNPESRIGRIYDRLCAVIPGGDVPAPEGEKPADAVIINLGTNDNSAFDRVPLPEQDAFRREIRCRAAELIRMARKRNPGAYILWAYGLCGNQLEGVLRQAVKDSGDPNAGYLALTPARSNGSRMHPSRESHETAAQEIISALKEHLK